MKIDEYIVVTDEKYHYTTGYYTMNRWTSDGDLILTRFVDMTRKDKENPTELVRYSVSKRCVVDVLCDNINDFYDCVVHEDMVYFCTKDALKSVNLRNREYRTIYKFKDICFVMPHITNDGKYISLEGHRSDDTCDFLLVNTQTCTARVMFNKKFLSPFHEADHGMICPTNHEMFFFAHEGTTQYITNRMWAYDDKKGKMGNITKQEMTEDGALGEYFGHEMWASDGKGMYFVKYPQSPIKPTGLCYVDLESGKKEVLFSGYAYWHVGVSKDGKYLVADTMRGVFEGSDLCEVVVADLEKKTESVIDVVHSTGIHPCHPHPIFSPDSSKVVYNAYENNKVVVKIAFLTM